MVVSKNSGNKEIARKITYSCASLTSPVMAERPMYGFNGREISFNVKQSLHSPPNRKVRTGLQIRD
jgi:hypothetical protein